MREQATAVIAPVTTGPARRIDRWFYISMALMMIVLSIVAFGPSIIDLSARNVPLPLTSLVLAHAIVSAAWLDEASTSVEMRLLGLQDQARPIRP